MMRYQVVKKSTPRDVKPDEALSAAATPAVKKREPSRTGSRVKVPDNARPRKKSWVPRNGNPATPSVGSSKGSRPSKEKSEKPSKAQGSETSKKAGKRGIVAPPEKTEEKPVVTPPRMAFTRPWVMSDALLEIVSSAFPMYNVTRDLTKPALPHDHPRSALERALVEDIICKDLCRKYGNDVRIIDIGGNPKRHAQAKRKNVHCCCPILSPSDAIRNARYEGRKKPLDYCTNCVQDCQETCDVYIMIHSLYYIGIDDVLKLLFQSGKNRMVASVHRFDDGYGKYHFDGVTHESEYACLDSKTVKMTVRGNDHGAYTHDPCFWLNRNYYENDGLAMAWGYRRYGDTYVYEFIPAQCGLDGSMKTQRLDIFSSCKNATHFGDVDIAPGASRPTMEFMNVHQTTVQSYGPLFWTTTNTRSFFVTKDIVMRIAGYMVGKPRDKDSWTNCVREAKKMLQEKYVVLPEHIRTLMCIYVPALAFIIHLDDEIAAFNALIEPKAVDRFSKLTRILSFVPRPKTICERMTTCFRPRENVVETVTSSQIVQDEFKYDQTVYSVAKAKVAGGLQICTVAAAAVVCKLRPSAKIIIHENQPEKPRKIGAYQIATAFSDYIPVVSSGSQQDMLVALSNRVCMETPAVTPGAWDSVRERMFVEKHFDFDLLKQNIDFDLDRSFKKWNKECAPSKQKAQLAAYIKLQSEPLEKKHLIRKTFCKIEKLNKASVLKPFSTFVPRAIQGATHEANVTLGPYMKQFSKGMAAQWNGTGKFYYAAGATGVSLGKWMADSYHVGDWIMDVDFTSYDGTQCRDAYETSAALYKACGIEDYGDAFEVLESHKDIRGFTSTGIEYRTDDGMCSGNPDTSCSNSAVTGVSTENGLNLIFGSTEGMKIAVMGDDNTTIIPEHYMASKDPERVKAAMVEYYLTLGLIAKINITQSLAKAEFCSGVFWPMQVDGVETYVLGGKPGKQFPKIAYALKKHDLSTVKGMFEGLKHAYRGVPFLDTYVESMLAKMPGKATKFVDLEARYKIRSSDHALARSVHLADFVEERYGINLVNTDQELGRLLATCDLETMVRWETLDVLTATD